MCREPFAPYCQLLGQSWFQCAAAVNISGHDLQQKTTWIDICFYSMSQKRSFCKLYLLSLFCGENHCAMCHLLSRLCFIKLCKDCWNSLGHSFSLHWLLIYRRDSIYLVFCRLVLSSSHWQDRKLEVHLWELWHRLLQDTNLSSSSHHSSSSNSTKIHSMASSLVGHNSLVMHNPSMPSLLVSYGLLPCDTQRM